MRPSDGAAETASACRDPTPCHDAQPSAVTPHRRPPSGTASIRSTAPPASGRAADGNVVTLSGIAKGSGGIATTSSLRSTADHLTSGIKCSYRLKSKLTALDGCLG